MKPPALELHDDIHVTATYRRHLTSVLTVRALTRAGEGPRRR
jgi:CO/xanthine dehydrogenase FAD-binding subunit